MKLNVALLRVSTDKQDTELQKSEILNYCKDNNLKIDTWIENVESGKKKKLNNMQGIKEIKKLIKENKLGKIIVYRQDRISRRAIEVLSFIDELNKQGIEIYATNKGKIETDKIGLVVSFMDAYVSEVEVENTRERITSKLKSKNENNEYAGGGINFGYKYNKDTKDIEICEEEAILVKRIFNDYISKGVIAIARELREEGITKRTTGKDIKWSSASITKILNNYMYIGRRQYGQTVRVIEDGEEKWRLDRTQMQTQDYNPNYQIIDEELFYKVQELRQERRVKNGGYRKTVRSRELLEGLVYHCCGDGEIRKMYISYNYDKKSGKGTSVFKCNDCQNFKRKVQKSFVTHRIDDTVIQYIKSFASNIDKAKIEEILVEQRQDGMTEIFEMLEVHKNNLVKYTNRHRKANEELEKYFDGESGLTSEKINAMIDSSKLEIDNSNKQIEILESELASKQFKSKDVEHLLKLFNTFGDVFDNADFDNKKALLREIVDKIIVEKGRIEVIFKLNHFFNIIP